MRGRSPAREFKLTRTRQRARTEGNEALTTRCEKGAWLEESFLEMVALGDGWILGRVFKLEWQPKNQKFSCCSKRKLLSNAHGQRRVASVWTKSAPSRPPPARWSV